MEAGLRSRLLRHDLLRPRDVSGLDQLVGPVDIPLADDVAAGPARARLLGHLARLGLDLVRQVFEDRTARAIGHLRDGPAVRTEDPLVVAVSEWADLVLSCEEITVFHSAGLAIQDLAIALAAMERADELDLPIIELQL